MVTLHNATVVISRGAADTVYIKTNMPAPMPNISNDPLHIQFRTEKNKGAQYVRDNFGIEPRVINQ